MNSTAAIPSEKHDRLNALARRLAVAWKAAGQIDTVEPGELPANRAEACAVQDLMAAAIDQPIAGWKVGATSARMRELDGHDDVIPGRMFAATTFVGDRQTLPITRFPNARVETEFAFRLLDDIPIRGRNWQADELAPRVTLHPAIEIIGNRHSLPDAVAGTRSLMTIADNGGGIGFVFGAPIANWQDRSIDFQQHEIELVVDNGAVAENFLGAMRCVPIQALADLVNHLASRGIGLSQGDFVSTGAATVPQPVVAGSQVVADFGTIGRIELQFK